VHGPAAIAVEICVVGIIVIPSIIAIGKTPQVGRVIVIVGIRIVVVVIYNYGSNPLVGQLQRIILLVLIGIEGFTTLRSIRFPQHFCFPLHLVPLIITQLLIAHGLVLAINGFLCSFYSLGGGAYSSCSNCGSCGFLFSSLCFLCLTIDFVWIIIDIIIF